VLSFLDTFDGLNARQHKILLYDFYGVLLTEKQKSVFMMHYMDDNSFAEISEVMNTTPQAVADLLKRTEAKLKLYESKMLLVSKFEVHKQTVNEIDQILNKMAKVGWTDIIDDTAKIKELVDTLI